MLNKEIKEDMKRAQVAFESAERNFKEDDILTAANRNFVACENSVYVLLKLEFGSSSTSRMKILTRLKEIDREIKNTYDECYDLRVQADYGKEAKLLPLNKENLENTLDKVRKIVTEVQQKLEDISF